jgi:hypothetical protein
MDVFDGIEIEEACARDALGKEGIVAIPAIVGQKPRSAERDNARLGGKFARIVLQGGIEL